ncbi:bifunctional DNA-binding transcriptional regulator/O6-methylguanine-DNA methyltransferase Ada [Croceicoccus sp. YJ47]|uniref:bifunctional DNA-binding transcriptional regulator/O6-methylguanine-DNA methyltransferase Ada n=1 Tax=Croceicoccus sp. YJ47 TaxID=2798724 RepID=UPI0019231E93|nr:bifunctional DNA-binding transcriptional regulator/O6-methylguanine-DNA methyltransferase Ada [Croceicoccus sp. YJ47]QQN74335.1 bifunctional DNA-binding transcriptional regulator/O6-methylguanine-DNA methyltransferase Ada [Croceicoccus sp. YJ47]
MRPDKQSDIRRSDPADENRYWEAVVRRDTAFEGKFVYAVTSTGIFCRPGCPSRLPKRENVTFFSDCRSAEGAGFRACRRCNPDGISISEESAAAISAACRLIETAEQLPTLDALAAAAGISPFHFHRQFKAITGLTPKEYGAAHRAKSVRHALAEAQSTVTQAIYDAGYNSGSRFYEKSSEMLGMTPTAFRDGGAGTEIKFAVAECSLGSILVACSAKGVCAILLGDDPDRLARDLQDRFAKAALIGGDKEFERLVAQVVGFVEAPGIGLDLPLDIRGTAFQQRVWQALRDIPAGQTASYAEIAARIGNPRAVRAVAQACGANAIAVAVPCHRVVRTDGSLSGYRWGVERKLALLEKEARP